MTPEGHDAHGDGFDRIIVRFAGEEGEVVDIGDLTDDETPPDEPTVAEILELLNTPTPPPKAVEFDFDDIIPIGGSEAMSPDSNT